MRDLPLLHVVVRVGMAAAMLAIPASAEPAPVAPPPVAPPGSAGAMARGAARTLAYAGLEDFKEQRFAAAHDKLERAYEVLKAPSVGLYTARTLERLGRWVAASERYLEVTRLPLGDGDASLQQEARDKATEARAALLSRIPLLTVLLPESAGALTIDGVVIPAALRGTPLPTDPGPHVLVVEFGGTRQEQRIELAERERRELRVDPIGVDSQAQRPPPPARPPAHKPQPRRVPRPKMVREPDPTFRTVGFVTAGVGAVALATGGVFLGLAVGELSALDASPDCRDRQCLPSEHDRMSRYSAYRAGSMLGLGAGALLFGGGLTLAFAAPTRERAVVAGLTLAPNGVVLRGSF